MSGFLYTVLIGISVYYTVKVISRLLAPFLIRMFFRRVSKKFENEMKKQKKSKNYKTQKKGNTIVEYEEDKKNQDLGGDYVDYEELDKN